MWITYHGYGTDSFLYTAGLCSVRTQRGPDHRLPRGPAAFCPLLTTDAEAGRRKPWGPLFCPLLCSLLGVSLGGGWSPAASGQWWGWGLRPPQHLLRMAEGDPCSSSPGRTPSKGYQGHHGSKCPKGQVKAPGDDEAPRLQSPRPLCCQTVQLLVRTPFRPSALVILDPHLAPCSRVSSSSRNRAPPSSTADFTPIPPGTCAPAPPSPTFPGLCGPQQGAHYCSTLGTSFAHPDTHSTLTGPTGKKCFSKAPSAVVTGVADSGSPPPSASWGAALANAEAGSRCVLTPGTNGSSWAPELSHGSDGAPVLAGGPRQGTDALMCDDRLLKGGGGRRSPCHWAPRPGPFRGPSLHTCPLPWGKTQEA